MKEIPRLLIVAAVAAVAPLSVLAQAAAARPASAAASSAPPAKPEKRLLSPTEQRDSATTPDDLRTEHRVTPQINIPLNKGTAPKASLVPPPRATAKPSGGIDDSAARCAALADAQAREECRAKLGR